MTQSAQVNGDLVVTGGIYGPTAMDIPASTVVNSMVSGSAAIAASKCQKGLEAHVRQSGTASDETIIAHVVKGATGIIKHFTVSNVVDCVGSSTVTVDLQNNGVSVLAATVTLDSSTGNLGEETATVDTPALTDGDILTVVITTSASGTDPLCTGIMAQVSFDEDYAT